MKMALKNYIIHYGALLNEKSLGFEGTAYKIGGWFSIASSIEEFGQVQEQSCKCQGGILHSSILQQYDSQLLI